MNAREKEISLQGQKGWHKSIQNSANRLSHGPLSANQDPNPRHDDRHELSGEPSDSKKLILVAIATAGRLFS